MDDDEEEEDYRDASIATTRIQRLAELLDARGTSAHAWPEDDLRAMLGHLMTTPLHLAFPSGAGRFPALFRENALPLTYSLGDLFADPSPPAAVLRWVKSLVKAGADRGEHPLPRDMLLLVYYALVALARVRGVGEISGIKPEPLARGLAWAATLRWAHPQVQAVIREAAPATPNPPDR